MYSSDNIGMFRALWFMIWITDSELRSTSLPWWYQRLCYPFGRLSFRNAILYFDRGFPCPFYLCKADFVRGREGGNANTVGARCGRNGHNRLAVWADDRTVQDIFVQGGKRVCDPMGWCFHIVEWQHTKRWWRLGMGNMGRSTRIGISWPACLGVWVHCKRLSPTKMYPSIYTLQTKKQYNEFLHRDRATWPRASRAEVNGYHSNMSPTSMACQTHHQRSSRMPALCLVFYVEIIQLCQSRRCRRRARIVEDKRRKYDQYMHSGVILAVISATQAGSQG